MKKSVFAFLTLFFLLVILFIWQSDEQDLGDNYYYLPEYEAIDIGFPDGAIIYKGTQRYAYDDIKIHSEVISVKHNDDFIVAIQKTGNIHVDKADSKFVHMGSMQYFIIVKKSDLVLGPYNKTKYLEMREKLKVPKSLKLNIEPE
jgi:hypothetical protein